MKALIIDDEKHVREAIRLLVPWESYGIGTVLEASDGLAAMETIERERPAIVFTDMMMPRLGGMELMEWIAKEVPGSKMIVISGHEDFSFVRHAVKYGGIDYILKPIDPDQLNAAVGKAVDGWRADEEARNRDLSRSMEIHRLKPVYRDQYFNSLLLETKDDPSVRETLRQEFSLPGPVNTARAAVLSLDFAPSSIRRKFAAGWDLLFFSVTNVCNEILRGRDAGYAFRNREEENEIVLILWGAAVTAETLLKELGDAIARSLKVRFPFGLGAPAAFPGKLQTSYRQARAALRHSPVSPVGSGVRMFEAGQETEPVGEFFYRYEERIRFAVQSGSREQVQAALEPWFTVLEGAQTRTLEQLRVWWREFRLALSIWRQQAGLPSGEAEENGEDGFPPVLEEDGTFALAAWKERFLLETCELAERLPRHGHGDGSTMKSIAAYVEQFAFEDLSLQDIANRFYLSREYISRKFKQEMNENLTDFIARVRVERARELLLNPQFKISRVAEMVGFQDEKYFSKVFKKWTGCSPGEFRKNAKTPPSP
ncbi:response regulator [Cohnella candidum]|uniref:Response regulator n=1 Tax=Cohnella candidum TaxID=2674991 RepID=A0A3G3JUG3_9BACL|nr:response regulator [Cohnella candidum]AYQ71866.1 response regulator [Cohnella candidum]